MSQSSQIEELQSQPKPDRIKTLRTLAFFLDNSIPIPFTKYRMGVDPILGLLGIVGGTGDILGGALGAYIIAQAANMGVPQEIIWQMVGNIFFDSLVGLVPALGDLLDITWKANARNIALLDQYFETGPKRRKNNPLFVFGVIFLLTIMVIGFASIAIAILQVIFSSVS